jgi:hypothetical protein
VKYRSREEVAHEDVKKKNKKKIKNKKCCDGYIVPA